MYNSTESFALINGCVILPNMSEVLTCQREGGDTKPLAKGILSKRKELV